MPASTLRASSDEANMNLPNAKDAATEVPSFDVRHLPFMSGACWSGPEARRIREKIANADFTIPEDVLAKLKMGQETVE